MDTEMTTALARTSDPVTSHEAARSVNVAALEASVVSALKTHGPMTSIDIARILGVGRDSVSPRMPKLRRDALVIDTGVKASPNGGGRRSIVWDAA